MQLNEIVYSEYGMNTTVNEQQEWYIIVTRKIRWNDTAVHSHQIMQMTNLHHSISQYADNERN